MDPYRDYSHEQLAANDSFSESEENDEAAPEQVPDSIRKLPREPRQGGEEDAILVHHHAEEPQNYYFESPTPHKVSLSLDPHHEDRTATEKADMHMALLAEMEKRHIANPHRKPLFVRESVADTTDVKLHRVGATKVYETVFDDLSKERLHVGRTRDIIENADIRFGTPDEETGILRTFIDRYTTMLVKDSIMLEEVPAPTKISMLIEGALKHDPRVVELHPDQEEDFGHHLDLHGDSLTPHEMEMFTNPDLQPFDLAGFVRKHGRESRDWYLGEAKEDGEGAPLAHHADRSNQLGLAPMQAKEGAKMLGEHMAMHFREPEQAQIALREQTSFERRDQHAKTLYDDDTWRHHHVGAHMGREEELAAFSQERYARDAGKMDHGVRSHEMGNPRARDPFPRSTAGLAHPLLVHDRYGEAVMDPFAFEHVFVHGTNYELTDSLENPIMEHNPHAFPTQKAPRRGAEKHKRLGSDDKERQQTRAKTVAPKRKPDGFMLKKHVKGKAFEDPTLVHIPKPEV